MNAPVGHGFQNWRVAFLWWPGWRRFDGRSRSEGALPGASQKAPRPHRRYRRRMLRRHHSLVYQQTPLYTAEALILLDRQKMRDRHAGRDNGPLT